MYHKYWSDIINKSIYILTTLLFLKFAHTKFNILLLRISMKSQVKKDHQVHIFTQKTCMKFIPKNFEKLDKKNIVAPVISKPVSKVSSRFSISSLFSRSSNVVSELGSDDKQKVSEDGQNSKKQIQSTQQIPGASPTQQSNNHNLKFAYRMTGEFFLIGNEFQLDVINILGVNPNNYVQTQYLYSFEFKDQIKHVSIDQKKLNLMAIIAGQTLYVYKYDAKKIVEQNMSPFAQLPLTDDVKFMQLAKDGNLCLFYQNSVDIYFIGDEIRRRYSKQYAKPDLLAQQGSSYSIFMVPEPFDNIINVFFQEMTSSDSKIFTLWALEFQFLSQIKPTGPKKVYQVKNSLKSSMSIKNYSKELFLMNLGGEILALKKGYVLDSATVNLKHESSYLEYLGNETLLHISQKKVEVYSFQINTNIKPFRIVIKSRDSIKVSNNDPDQKYFKVINILNNDYLVIYQKGTVNSKSKTGEIHYSFYLTRGTTRQGKMNKLFPKGLTVDKVDDPVLLDKCDMAQKMGFTIRQIYLQLWSRSLQSKFQDFQILIATKDYSTIKQETIKKLKKASMKLTDIKQIEELAFKMLNSRVFNPSCTEEIVMDYISSHFFNRKIKMFEKTLAIEKAERQKKTEVIENDFRYKMTIRQYQEYRSMQIKTQLISLVNQFCHEGKTSSSNNIRLLLQHFKFVFRTIYYELLDQIIKNAKDKLLDLIKQIPQLLPYSPPADQSSVEPGFYEGVWAQINKSQWNESLYIDAITTIDNKQIVLEQVIKNINFKRNWLSQHDMVLWSVQKIKANEIKIKSPLTFYYFIAKMFNYVRDQSVLKQIVQFLQNTYELPSNIKGNIFLMEKMYKFFVDKSIVPEIDGKPLTFDQFLAFEDKQYIRHCFQKQRSNKGLLLKDLKDIFKQVLHEPANEKYNNAILNYFTSDLSEVSDLKYILNRINNQKVQFHQQNQEMYEVLVLALEKKLKIGTDDDIPIQQVLIYIENIPLKFNTQPSKSLSELKSVEKIQKESQMLRRAKVNMSIYDILHNSEEVFTKILRFEIQNAPFQIWQSYEAFEEFAISKIAFLENFSEQIYNDSHEKDIFFIFLTSLCQKIERIRFADFLLKNEHFQQRLDPNTVQGLVLFMKKWKLSADKQYVKNEQYIRHLLTLLPPQSDFYTYIECELQFAKILSAPGFPVTYPISDIYITASDIRDIIFQLPVSFVQKIPIKQLYEVVQKMQDILLRDIQNDEGQQYLTLANRVTLHQIYQFVIIKLINCNKLKQVLPLIREILSIEISNSTYNIVYLILFSISISNQFNENIRNNIFLCIWHYFFDPMSLLQIYEYLLNKPLSSKQIKVYVEQCVARGRQKHKGYDEHNPIFDQDYIKMIKSKQDQNNFMLTLQKTSRHIQQSKQQFKHVKYTAIMIMLCNSPFALAKYISCSSSYDLHVKSIRSFLSYAINEKVFKPFNILQFGKRVFLSLLEAAKNKFPIEVVIEKYQNKQQYSLDESIQIQGYEPPKQKNNYEYLMWKSAEAFKKKKAALALQAEKKLKANSPPESALEKSQRLRSQLDKGAEIDERDPFEYPFTEIDSDNNDANNQAEIDDLKKKKKKQAPKFDPSQQMKMALKVEGRSHKLFLSTRGQISNKNSNNLMISIRQPYKTTQYPIHKSTEGMRQLKMPKYEQRLAFKQGLDHRQSQDFEDLQRMAEECKTERDEKLRPSSHSAFESQPRHSADSSPDVLQNKFGIVEHELQKSQQILQYQDKEKVNNSGQGSQIKEQQLQVEPYAIKINEAFDADQIAEMNKNIPQSIDFNQSPEIMVESTEFENPLHTVSIKLIQQNKEALQSPFPQYNLDSLKPYSNNKKAIIDILRQLYRQHQNKPSFQKVMKLIGQIVSSYPVCQIDPQKFAIIIKAQQAQAKTIPEIKFNDLMTEASIFAEYNSKRDLFEKLYSRLNKFVDSENIYKITQFVRRVFDNPQFQQEVTWDFILDLADKLQVCEEEERTWTLQKIQGNLPKVDISIWNRTMSIFQVKVLTSSEKSSLLKVFCNYLKDQKGNLDAITFLQNLMELDNSEIIKQTLDQIQLKK